MDATGERLGLPQSVVMHIELMYKKCFTVE
jgi:hypothetical protein